MHEYEKLKDPSTVVNVKKRNGIKLIENGHKSPQSQPSPSPSPPQQLSVNTIILNNGGIALGEKTQKKDVEVKVPERRAREDINEQDDEPVTKRRKLYDETMLKIKYLRSAIKNGSELLSIL